jgi:hypothetical protein
MAVFYSGLVRSTLRFHVTEATSLPTRKEKSGERENPSTALLFSLPAFYFAIYFAVGVRMLRFAPILYVQDNS